MLCEKSAGQRARQKRLRLHSVCWWCVRLRSHKRTTFLPLPSLAFYATDGEYIYLYIYLSKRRETICLSVIAGKREVEDLEESFLGPGVSPSPPLPVLTTRRARCGVGLEI